MKKIILTLITLSQLVVADRLITNASTIFLNDYVNRGVSKTALNPAVQGAVGFNYGYISTNLIGTNVNITTQNSTISTTAINSVTSEYYLYGGLVGLLADGVGFNVGYSWYFYPDERAREYGEAYIGFIKRFGLALRTDLTAFYTTLTNQFSDIESKISYDFGYFGASLKAGRNYNAIRYSDYTIVDYTSFSIMSSYFLDLDITLGYRMSFNPLDNYSTTYENYILTVGKGF